MDYSFKDEILKKKDVEWSGNIKLMKIVRCYLYAVSNNIYITNL